MKKQSQLDFLVTDPKIKLMLMILSFVALLIISNYVFASDVLAGTDSDIKDTIAGTGRHWIIFADGIAAILGFITRKNPMILGSVVVVTVFLNLLIFLTK